MYAIDLLKVAEDESKPPLVRIDCYLELARLNQEDVYECWTFISKAQDLAK